MYNTIVEIKKVVDKTLRKCKCKNLIGKIKIEFNGRFTQRLGDARYNPKSKKGEIRFSRPLWPRTDDTERYNTIVHEVCHIVTHKLHGYAAKAHGREWKDLMILCGVKPDRCHNVPVDHRFQQRVSAWCECQEHLITKNKRTRIINGQLYFCRTCDSFLSLRQ